MTKYLIILALIIGVGAANVAAYHVMKEAPKAVVTRTIEKQIEKHVAPVAIKQVKEVIKKKPKVNKQKAEMAAWCTEIKEYVAKYGEDAVREGARARGYTFRQMRAAGRCLR